MKLQKKQTTIFKHSYCLQYKHFVSVTTETKGYWVAFVDYCFTVFIFLSTNSAVSPLQNMRMGGFNARIEPMAFGVMYWPS